MFSICCYLNGCVHIVLLFAYYLGKAARETNDIAIDDAEVRYTHLSIYHKAQSAKHPLLNLLFKTTCRVITES